MLFLVVENEKFTIQNIAALFMAVFWFINKLLMDFSCFQFQSVVGYKKKSNNEFLEFQEFLNF